MNDKELTQVALLLFQLDQFALRHVLPINLAIKMVDIMRIRDSEGGI